MPKWSDHKTPVAEPFNPADNTGRLSMRDVRFRVRGRAALQRLTVAVNATRGADLALVIAKLEAISPEPDSPEDAALKASNAVAGGGAR